MSTATARSNQAVPDVPWWVVLLGGLAAIIVGILLLMYPAATTVAIVRFIAIYWLFTGVLSLVMMFIDRSKWGWKLFYGLLGIAAGLIVLSYPLVSAVALPTIAIYIVAFMSIVMGIVGLIQAFQGGGWGMGILGVLVILIGIVLLFNPFLAALGLPFVVGVLAVGFGIIALFAAFQVRGLQKTAQQASSAPVASPPAVRSTPPASSQVKAEEGGIAGEVAAAPTPAGMAAAGTMAAVMSTQEEAAADEVHEMETEPEDEHPIAAPETAGAMPVAAAGMAQVEEPDVSIPEPETPEEMAKFKQDLTYVEGIGQVYAEKLNAAGIGSLLELLRRGATRKGRQEIADASGISGTLILKWVNHADLYRIKGVGSEYADLLEAAGVDTVVELSTRNPENLMAKMTEVNESKHLVRKMPVQTQVQEWVEQAQTLPRVVQY